VNPLFAPEHSRVEIAKTINGEPMLSTAGISLLMGIDERFADGYLKRDPVIPAEWIKSGRRRSAEYRAHTGRADMLGSLAYWADKDHPGATIVEDPDGTIWMAFSPRQVILHSATQKNRRSG
jgi:hypothetical protein